VPERYLSHLFITASYLHALAEWMESQFSLTTRKWDAIESEIDMRSHRVAMGAPPVPDPEGSPEPKAGSRAALRLFGKGGVVEDWTRRIYAEGYLHIQSNSFPDQDAKDEFSQFCDNLTAEEKEMVKDATWQ
jgi:hypothetical protein